MTQETQTQEVQQEPIFISLTLRLDQINFVLGALGKMPTESGAWMLQQAIGSQAEQQLVALREQQAGETEPTVQ